MPSVVVMVEVDELRLVLPSLLLDCTVVAVMAVCPSWAVIVAWPPGNGTVVLPLGPTATGWPLIVMREAGEGAGVGADDETDTEGAAASAWRPQTTVRPATTGASGAPARTSCFIMSPRRVISVILLGLSLLTALGINSAAGRSSQTDGRCNQEQQS